MAGYSEFYRGDELTKLREGLDVIERVIDNERLQELEMFLYGIVTDATILSMAKEAIIDLDEDFDDNDDHTLTEDDIELNEIAVAVPIYGPNVIDVLYGRGVSIEGLSFAYMAGEGEGVRSMSFLGIRKSSVRLRADDMGTQALAETDMGLDEYLKKEGKGTSVNIKRKVERNMEATTPVPHPPEEAQPSTPPATPTPPPPAPVQGTPKQTSLKISNLLESFLGKH